MGQLPDPQLPRRAGDRGDADAAARRAAAGRGRVVLGAGHGGDRQRDLRCDRRALSRSRRSRPRWCARLDRLRCRRPRRGPGEGRRPAGGAARPRRATFSRRAQAQGSCVATAGALVVGGIGARRAACSAGAPPSPRSRSARTGLHRRHHRTRPPARRARRLRRLPHRAGRHAQRRRPRHARRPSARSTPPTSRPMPSTGLGRWSLQRVPARDARRHLARRPPPVPGVSVHRLREDQRRRPAGALRLLHVAARGARRTPRGSELRFPFSLRPLMARWNALFHDPAPRRSRCPRTARSGTAAPTSSTASATAAPATRRAMRSARSSGGSAYLARRDGRRLGGAGAHRAVACAAVPWNADELYRYLRHGHDAAARHRRRADGRGGARAARCPIADMRAMAHLPRVASTRGRRRRADALARATAANKPRCCAAPRSACSTAPAAPATTTATAPSCSASNAPLALNSNLHSARPDNLLRTILDGVREPAFTRDRLHAGVPRRADDAQIAELAGYMRQRFAPGQLPWVDLAAAVARARAQH